MASVIKNFSVKGIVGVTVTVPFTLFSINESGVSGFNKNYFFRVFVNAYNSEDSCDYRSDLIYGRVRYIDDGVVASFVEAEVGNPLFTMTYTISFDFPNVILSISHSIIDDVDIEVSLQGVANGLILT
jgi:hypothetical protein